MKSTHIAILAVISLAACSSQQYEANDTTPMGFMGARWSATLTPPAGSPSPQVAGTGSVMGTSDSAQTKVQVSLNSATPDATLPWHLHRGTCGNDLGIVGDPMAYAPLKVGSDGRASGTATIAMTMPTSGAYMFNVHASPTELAVIVACGNLTGPNGG